MTVESQAGRFLLSFDAMEPGDGEILIKGRMGVWSATTHMSLAEFVGILRLTLRPRMLRFLLGSLFARRRAPAPS
jgi:hypothetical protein